jgi:transcriptional regulator with XRE-family HTH domain
LPGLVGQQGLSIEQFAKLVDSSPEEILELTKDGIVTEALLERICSFFGISKTKEFMKYVRRPIHSSFKQLILMPKNPKKEGKMMRDPGGGL